VGPQGVLPHGAAPAGWHQWCTIGPSGSVWPAVGTWHPGTLGPCGHHGPLAPSSKCWGAPLGPIGCDHVVPQWLAVTSGVHKGPSGSVCWVGSGAWQRYWPLWVVWVVCPKQWVLVCPSGPQGVHPCVATSDNYHQWGTPGQSGSVGPLGGRGCTGHSWPMAATMGGGAKVAGVWGTQGGSRSKHYRGDSRAMHVLVLRPGLVPGLSLSRCLLSRPGVGSSSEPWQIRFIVQLNLGRLY